MQMLNSDLVTSFYVLAASLVLLTSRGLSRLPGRAGLPLVGVIGAVKLHRPQVEHHGLLDVVHHRQTITVPKHHTVVRDRGAWMG